MNEERLVTEIRHHYAHAVAAKRGNRAAFDRIWSGMSRPLSTALRRSLELERAGVTEAGLGEILEQVRTRSFAELPEKPDDWSTYGWIAWIAQREVIRRQERGEVPHAP